GVNGQTTAQMSADAASQIDTLLATRFSRKIYVHFSGVNDLGSGDTTGAYNAIASDCLGRRNAGYQVVVVTILPRSDGATPSGFEANRQTVNTSIRNGIASFGTVVADAGADATIGVAGASSNATYYGDGLHLLSAGDAILASVVKTAIDTLS